MNLFPVAMLGSTEILVIAVVVLVLFGAKKVPELMKGVGTGIKEFKKASRDVQDELHRAMDEVDRTPPSPPQPPAAPSATVPKPDPDAHAHGSERPPEQKG
ncbi:MAG: twin-arginine translocase TatA/TatE family subunit [Verrucomicrobiota bacterium]